VLPQSDWPPDPTYCLEDPRDLLSAESRGTGLRQIIRPASIVFLARSTAVSMVKASEGVVTEACSI
jgi:hypothetical protein